ncbi:MAG: hypothetical protein ACYC61_11735 [Isosphaeraceae bacterium]
MIASLEDAWTWYDRVRKLAKHIGRLGEHFWDREDWAETLAHDNVFRDVDSVDLLDNSRTILEDLDDLGVLLMFSVFEAIVRDQAWTDIVDSLPDELHPAVGFAISELEKDVKGGSFGRVTEAFKSLDHDLIEAVNQVRRYRNWVAHGRRGQRPDAVTPAAAYERLNAFLTRMGEAAAPSGPDLAVP